MKTHKTHQLDIKDVHVSLQAVGVTYRRFEEMMKLFGNKQSKNNGEVLISI